MKNSHHKPSPARISLQTFLDKIRFVLSFLVHQKLLLGTVLGVEIMSTILISVIPYFTKIQIDQLEQQRVAFAGITFPNPLWLFALALIIPKLLDILRRFVLDTSNHVLMSRLETGLRVAVEKLIWNKLETLDAGFFENRRNQQIVSWTLNSTKVIRATFNYFKNRLNDGTALLTILPLFALVSWQLLCIVLIVSVLQLLINQLSKSQETAQAVISDHRRERLWKVTRALSDDYQTLRIMGATSKLLVEYHALLAEADQHYLFVEKKRQHIRLYEWLAENALSLATHLFVGWQVIQGTATLGTFSVVVAYTMQINGVFQRILESVSDWNDIELDFDKLHFFFLLKPRIKQLQPSLPLPKKITRLRLGNVHFSYPHFYEEEKQFVEMMVKKVTTFLTKHNSFWVKYELQDWQKLFENPPQPKQVLAGVNLELEVGKVTALLGRNGAGKTTITQLLLHQFEPDLGTITLENTPLYALAQAQYLQLFSIIQQQPFILDRFSIRDNILLGSPGKVSDQKIWEVCERIDLKKTIEQLPKKLDTILGEDSSLSGGQEQLIAVARVLIQDRPLIIFDEGLNQMDIEHETKIVEVLKQKSQHAAVLFITHRLTTARRADVIHVLDEGTIVETGTHQSLLQKKGLYAKFWQMQVLD